MRRVRVSNLRAAQRLEALRAPQQGGEAQGKSALKAHLRQVSSSPGSRASLAPEMYQPSTQ